MANNKRNYYGFPCCGDLWKLKDNTYLVVDYVDTFCTGFTISDGNKILRRDSYRYTQRFENFLKNNSAELISKFEDIPYPTGVDNKGWTDRDYITDDADIDGLRSLYFIQDIINEYRTNVKEIHRR